MTHSGEVKSKKKFPWGKIIGGLFMILFATCSYAIVGVFKNVAEVKPINEAFLNKVLYTQLPPANSGVYSDKSGITDATLAQVNTMITNLGAPNELSKPNCSGNSNASTGELSGEFVTCSANLSYDISPGTILTRWRKENDEWKLLMFNLRIADFEAYTDLVVQQKLEEEKGNKAEDETE